MLIIYDNDMECGNRIKALRKQRKLTQNALAEAVGTCAANISRVESGEHSPRLELLQRLARFFETSLDYVAGGDGHVDRVPAETARVMELARKAGESATLASYFEYLARRRELSREEEIPTVYGGFPRGLPYMTTAEVAALFAKFGGDLLPRMAHLDPAACGELKTALEETLSKLERRTCINKRS